MRRILNESARMKKIAGIISEGNYEEGADMAKSDEITMEGDEVNEYSAAKSLGSSAKLNTFADMIAYFGTDYDGDFVDVSGKPRYPKAAQDFYRANIAKYRDWLDNFESDPMYKLHLMVKKAAGEYGGFN